MIDCGLRIGEWLNYMKVSSSCLDRACFKKRLFRSVIF